MYVQIGSSVIICYVRVRETILATANRLQRYNKNLKYTNLFMFFVVFCFRARKLHTFGMYYLAQGVATNHS